VSRSPGRLGRKPAQTADRRLLPLRVAKITVIGQEITLLGIRMLQKPCKSRSPAVRLENVTNVRLVLWGRKNQSAGSA
jgi:hypothetical protein